MTNDTELLMIRVAEVFITIDIKRDDKMKPNLRPNDNLTTCLTNGRQYNLSSDLTTKDDYLAADQGWTKANHTQANLSCKAHDCTSAMLKATAQLNAHKCHAHASQVHVSHEDVHIIMPGTPAASMTAQCSPIQAPMPAISMLMPMIIPALTMQAAYTHSSHDKKRSTSNPATPQQITFFPFIFPL
jgi:hypothetical protein